MKIMNVHCPYFSEKTDRILYTKEQQYPQKLKHIMELIPKFREIIEDLERIKEFLVRESKISYTGRDARMLALDSLQISVSAVRMWACPLICVIT